MATLKAHGEMLGKIDYGYYAKAYFANGDILKDSGFGWKICSHVREGVNPLENFGKKTAYQAAAAVKYPQWAAWIKALKEACGLSKRWKLIAAIELMPDDPDGVWSEVSDGYGDNLELSIEEIAELCRLYKLGTAEVKEAKSKVVDNA